MRRQIPGLCRENGNGADILEGIFLVRVEGAYYRWHPQRPFFVLQFLILEPQNLLNVSITGRLYCSPKALWRLSWFLRDFGYDRELIGQDQVDEKALIGLRGVLRTSHATLNGRSFVNLDGFAPAEQWEDLRGLEPSRGRA